MSEWPRAERGPDPLTGRGLTFIASGSGAREIRSRNERRVFPREQVLLLQRAVERRLLRVVAPEVVTVADAEAAEQLLLHRVEVVPPRLVRQVEDLVADRDPAVRVPEEDDHAGGVRVVVRPGVADAAVEEHHVA